MIRFFGNFPHMVGTLGGVENCETIRKLHLVVCVNGRINFCLLKFSWNLTRLWQPITPIWKLPHPKTTTFLESSGRQLFHGPILFFSPVSKYRGMSVLWKMVIFSIFSWPHGKKIQKILIRPILTFDALPIAHFEAYVPNFLKHLWKLAISLKLWVPAASEVRWSRTVS